MLQLKKVVLIKQLISVLLVKSDFSVMFVQSTSDYVRQSHRESMRGILTTPLIRIDLMGHEFSRSKVKPHELCALTTYFHFY